MKLGYERDAVSITLTATSSPRAPAEMDLVSFSSSGICRVFVRVEQELGAAPSALRRSIAPGFGGRAQVDTGRHMRLIALSYFWNC
jgi:hypothetical protein